MLKSSIAAMLCLLAVAAFPQITRAQGGTTAKITFGEIPIAGEGSDSRGNIDGKITGLSGVQNFKVVVYAFTDVWYVQPLVTAPFTDLNDQGERGTWTHLGTRYAVLVVRPSFRPQPKIVSLPSVGGDVLMKADVAAHK